MKVLQEIIEELSYNLRLGKNFLFITQNPGAMKEKY